MTLVEIVRAADLPGTLALLAEPGAKAIAGGTNLVDLMQEGIERPARLVDLNRLPGLDGITEHPDGTVEVGALVRNSDLAYHPAVAGRFAMLSRAVLAGATAQLRNAASVGGNLMQRTRCPYFVDLAAACNKRSPGAGCDALEGINRMHAILGAGDRCIATHPSDMAVALAALNADVVVAGPDGVRTVSVLDFHVLPDDHPDVETVLRPGELITAVRLPPPPFASSTYLKVRDRTSYAFALVSVAAGLALDSGGRIAAVRLALGGVGTKPWRAWEAEAALLGHTPAPEIVRAAADLVLREARPRRHNSFKVELTRRAMVRAVMETAGQPPAALKAA